MNVFTQSFLFFCLMAVSLMATATPAGVWDIQCINVSAITVVPDTCSQGVGSITVEHDGTAPFMYSWSHDSTLTDSLAGQLIAGTYSLNISDSSGCTADTMIILGNFNPMTITATSTPDTCGAPNGTATVNVILTGLEAEPFTFQWDSLAGNQTTQVALGLSTGTYTVVATDARGCEASQEVNVGSVANGFSGVMSVMDALCFGDSNGIANVSPMGGNGEYAYQWTAVGDTTILSTDSTAMGLPIGQYQVVMTDPNGAECEFIGFATIRQPDSLVAAFLIDGASSCREPDGEVYALPVGGTPPYQYLWDNGETNDTIVGLPAGFYMITVTDTNGCSDTKVVPLTSDTGPEFTIEVLQEDNCGLGEGIARINVELGTAPYQTEWWVQSSRLRDTATNPLFAYGIFATPEANNDYIVVVMDADSCLNIANFRMPGNPPLAVDNISSTTNYCELSDGTTTVEISGGTEPYTYVWTTTPPQTTPTATGLTAGEYAVTVRDSFNCVISDTVEVLDEEGFTLEVVTTDVSCHGADDGAATARVFDARWPMRWEWEDPRSAEATINNLGGGIYTVTATDVDGCQRTGFGEVMAVNFVQADFISNPPSGDTLQTVLSSAGFVFTNLSEGADEYLWDFGDGNISTQASPTHVYQDTGRFFVQLKALTNNGECADSLTLGPFIIAIDGILHVPNAFSPNGDGFNDFFDVKGELLSFYDLRVYSRWGEEIYQSSSIDNSWDGRLPNGRAAPQGVYVYRLQATAVGDKSYDETGTITLLR